MNNINRFRIKNVLTKEELANKLGVSNKLILKWELGLSSPSLDNIDKIANIFNISIDELVSSKIIKKIVLTGGPCAGKTTALKWIEKNFSKKGYKVLIVPEAASILINGGIDLDNKESFLEIQKSIINTQINLEDIFIENALSFKENKILIVCDRGLLDNKAYMSKKEYEFILKELKLSEENIINRYDAVFHLVTACKGAKEYYNLDNPARYETIEEAVKIDNKLIEVWKCHPYLKIIDNSTDFNNKMDRVIKEISSFLEKYD